MAHLDPLEVNTNAKPLSDEEVAALEEWAEAHPEHRVLDEYPSYLPPK